MFSYKAIDDVAITSEKIHTVNTAVLDNTILTVYLVSYPDFGSIDIKCR